LTFCALPRILSVPGSPLARHANAPVRRCCRQPCEAKPSSKIAPQYSCPRMAQTPVVSNRLFYCMGRAPGARLTPWAPRSFPWRAPGAQTAWGTSSRPWGAVPRADKPAGPVPSRLPKRNIRWATAKRGSRIVSRVMYGLDVSQPASSGPVTIPFHPTSRTVFTVLPSPLGLPCGSLWARQRRRRWPPARP
jgi:hypothetical protein